MLRRSAANEHNITVLKEVASKSSTPGPARVAVCRRAHGRTPCDNALRSCCHQTNAPLGAHHRGHFAINANTVIPTVHPSHPRRLRRNRHVPASSRDDRASQRQHSTLIIEDRFAINGDVIIATTHTSRPQRLQRSVTSSPTEDRRRQRLVL